jgi:hypothetical protein
MDWWMDLLTTYTHHSKLQVITPSQISTMLKSSLHWLSLFQPAVSSPVVPRPRLLTVKISQLYVLSIFTASRAELN